MRRILELDLLRFVAVLLVMGRHMTPCPESVSGWGATWSLVWQRGGWIGVDLFFVLSGFLVSGLLFQEHQKTDKVDIKRFLIRRGFKIYPPFWALILFTIVFQWVISAQADGTKIISELLFVQNYFPALWNHTWSLAVEEHFYILLSLLVLVFALWNSRGSTRETFQSIPKVFCWVALACLIMRMVNSVYLPDANLKHHLMVTHLRIDSLFFGVLLAYFWHTSNRLHIEKSWFKIVLIGLGALLLLPAFVCPVETTWWIPVFGVILFYVGSGLILVGMLNLQLPDSPILRTAGKIGAFSYSIYLWHMPMQSWFAPIILKFLPEPLSSSWLVYAAIYMLGSLVVGIAMAKLIESPTLLLRDKLIPKSDSKKAAGQLQKPLSIASS